MYDIARDYTIILYVLYTYFFTHSFRSKRGFVIYASLSPEAWIKKFYKIKESYRIKFYNNLNPSDI